MNITSCEVNTNNVENLPDSPTITSSELKKTFDKSSKDIKDYINDTLIGDIISGVNASKAEAQKLIKKVYKYDVTLGSDIDANTDYVVSTTYTVGSGNLDVFYEGSLLNVGEHYTERGTGDSSTVRFDWTVPSGSKLSFVIRK